MALQLYDSATTCKVVAKYVIDEIHSVTSECSQRLARALLRQSEPVSTNEGCDKCITIQLQLDTLIALTHEMKTNATYGYLPSTQ